MFGEADSSIFWTDEISAAVTCQDKRGGLFSSNESATWNYLGFYGLGWVILSQHFSPDWMQLTRSATCPSSICSEDKNSYSTSLSTRRNADPEFI